MATASDTLVLGISSWSVAAASLVFHARVALGALWDVETGSEASRRGKRARRDPRGAGEASGAA